MQGKPLQLTGQKFGLLIAKKQSNKRLSGSIGWECVCKCGRTAIIRSSALVTGHTKSCGCSGDGRLLELVGKKFGRLRVIRLSPSRKRGMRHWVCICDCGRRTVRSGTDLRLKRVLSCGCLGKENRRIASFKHGLGSSKIYHTWYGMMRRCYDKNCEAYKYYGGRGIGVCKRWHIVTNFHKDMQPRPDGGHVSIERRNVNGDYTPSNCYWALDAETQARNTRSNRVITHNGKSMLLIEWAEFLGIRSVTTRTRLGRLGWDIGRALSTPVDTTRRNRFFGG